MKPLKCVRMLLAVTVLVIFMGAYASADTITSTGLNVNTGTGFGSINNVLGLQAGGNATTEQGANMWNGTANTKTGYSGLYPAFTLGGCTGASCVGATGTANDVKNADQSNGGQVVLLSSLALTKTTDLAIIFQVNQTGGGLDPITLNGLTLYLFDSAGNIVYAANCGSPNNPCGQNWTGTGVGTSGWLFELTGTGLDPFIASSNAYYLGLGASGGDPMAANDGPDNFYLAKIVGPITTTPEPGSLVLFGSGAIALVSRLRRRARRS